MLTSDSAVEIPPTAGLPLYLKDLFPSWSDNFPQKVAEFLGVSTVGIECSGTACLIVILETLSRLSTRKNVVIPAYTCPLVIFAIVKSRLQLRVCDTSPNGFELDPEALAKLCDRDTLAIIPTHLGGRVADLNPIMTLAKQCGAYVVEDAAQALGARSQGKSVGLRGDAGFFSLAAGKGLSIFEGGVWIAANAELRAELRRTSLQIIPARLGWEALRCLQLAGYAAAYRPLALRYIYGNSLRRALRRRDSIAAAGDYFSSSIPLHRVCAWRQAVGSRALMRLADFPELTRIPGVTVLTDPPGAAGTWPVFIAELPNENVRDQVLDELWGAGLGVSCMFAYALPDYEYLRPWGGEQSVPNAKRFAACTMTISNSPWLDDVSFERILAILFRHCRSG
jgi:dTDP-4-amino-4,6-dideoxygalactose transaminase